MAKNQILIQDLDFEIESRKNDEEFNATYQKFCIVIIDNDKKTAEKLKKQILINQQLMILLKNNIEIKTFWKKNGNKKFNDEIQFCKLLIQGAKKIG